MTNIYLAKCFCTESTRSGNPAGVVLDFDGSKDDKLKLAKNNNLPVTVFVTNHTAASPLIEFYYPEREMPLCLHGTLAAAELLLTANKTAMQFLTNSDKQLKVHRNSDNKFLYIEVSAQPTENIDLHLHTITNLLNIKADQILLDMPLEIKSVGSPKLLIPFKSAEYLATLKPNYALIQEWSQQHNINGIYVYTPRDNQGTFQARGFNPKTGHNEDAATGVAAAALSLALKQNIAVEQGQHLGLPCAIVVSYNHPESIWIGGKVRLVHCIG